ncbi:MAG: hypothetical protein K6E40_08880 [Desulfovibrio sp.]|nr:hypothetical protein [Desulfovibrio sp.]
MQNAKTVRWLALAGLTAGAYVFFNFVSPCLFSLFPAWQRFVDVQDEIGVASGALYYTDVAVTQDAEAHVREAVRLGMEERARRQARGE